MIRYEIGLTPSQQELVKYSLDYTIARYKVAWVPPGWQRSKVLRVARQVYGILAVQQHSWKRKKDWREVITYRSVFVPPQNISATQHAVDTGAFEKAINEDHLPILRVVYERQEELRHVYGVQQYPRFYPREVAHLAGVTPDQARDHLFGLVGLLAISINDVRTERSYNSINSIHVRNSNKLAWFVPASRLGTIDDVLSF